MGQGKDLMGLITYNSHLVPYTMEKWKVTMAHIIWG